jgi:hypothetical protein
MMRLIRVLDGRLAYRNRRAGWVFAHLSDDAGTALKIGAHTEETAKL